MERGMIPLIRKEMVRKDSEELVQILKEHDTDTYAPEAFEAIKQILIERNIDLPESSSFKALTRRESSKTAKKWEYMLVDFRDRRVHLINGREVESFVQGEYKTTILDFLPFGYGTPYTPSEGIYITDFLNQAGRVGWEAISVIFSGSHFLTTIDTILFKREVAFNDKSVASGSNITTAEDLSQQIAANENKEGIKESNMWRCKKCGEYVEKDWDVCWNCQTKKKGV